MRLIIIGVLVHLLFLSAVFDIYFTTPIIHGMSPHSTDKPAKAKRLVLIVADGLRAESLYGSEKGYMAKVAPFLSSIRKSGSWGISHTRVPTESRPGHVALAAGIYEDPSAIAKGWKENPVEFDSVFNESRATWAWGSPDIVPMFAKVHHVFADSYSSAEEDFSGKQSTTLLDVWVFNKVEMFFKEARMNATLNATIQQDKIIFFLHLLGLDTAGHTHKPYSKEHTENIKVVDQGIALMEKIFNDFYGDKMTSFVFTADHGMTDWGSHGAGSDSETKTPFIAWGAGISSHDKMIEFNQADIAPLMSTLVSIPIPINSVGVLPLDCLDMTLDEKVSALLANAKQIYAQFDAKRRRTQQDSVKSLYYPFEHMNEEIYDKFIERIQRESSVRNYNEAIRLCHLVIKLSSEGLDYYQNYYQHFLQACIIATYIGWICMLVINITEPPFVVEDFILKDEEIQRCIKEWLRANSSHVLLNFIFSTSIMFTCFMIYSQSLPYMYYFYTIAPQWIWWDILKLYDEWSPRLWSYVTSPVTDENNGIMGRLFLFFVATEALVYCFFTRQALSIPLLIMSFWPFFLPSTKFSLNATWFVSCIILIVFPFMPVVGTSFDMHFINMTGLMWIISTTGYAFIPYFLMSNTSLYDAFSMTLKQGVLSAIQALLLLVTLWNMNDINKSLTNHNGLSLFNQCVSWGLLTISLIVPMFGTRFIPVRLFFIGMSLAVPFLLLSVSYEPLFFLTLFLNLILWLLIEHRSFNTGYGLVYHFSFKTISDNSVIKERQVVNFEDVRRSFFFLVYIILAFFGTGNIASVNSFDPNWVKNFVSTFSPFTMAALILFKILIPFLMVSCVFRGITICIRAPVAKLFYIMLIFGDILGMQFLCLVKNTGSWLEIGTSISHFVIVQTMVLFLLLLNGIAIVLTRFSFWKPILRYSKIKTHTM